MEEYCMKNEEFMWPLDYKKNSQEESEMCKLHNYKTRDYKEE